MKYQAYVIACDGETALDPSEEIVDSADAACAWINSTVEANNAAGVQIETWGAKEIRSSMNDRKFLEWVADRLVNVHGDNPNVDYVHKLRAIARATDPEQITPNVVP